jgi:hypothetical protein
MKKILLFILATLLFLGSTFAQRPSERRKIQQQQAATDAIQEESEEKVSDKKLSPSELRKQRLEKSNFESNLKEFNSDFDLNEAPEAYKKYSAVILAQTVDFDFVATKENGLLEKRKVRRKIAIQDKSALETFSMFYTTSGSTYKIFVIKPDKSLKEVSKKAALTEKLGMTDIPDFFFEFIGTSDEIVKLPIQGLEIGDVLDIQQAVDINSSVYSNPFASAPVVEVLSNNYPLLRQHFGMMVPPNYNIQLFSLNGAPKPEIENRSDGSRFYVISDTMRSTSNKEYYNYLLRSSPVIKFQLSQKSRVKTKNIGDNFDAPLSEDDIVQLANQRVSPSIEYQASLAKSTIRHIKSLKLPPGSTEEIVKQAYYFLRTVTLVKLDGRESTLILMYGGKLIKDGALESMHEDLFLGVLKDVFNEFEIDYVNIAGVSKKYGSIKDVIHQNEIAKGLKVNTNSKPLYIFNSNQHSHYNNIYPMMEGTEVLTYVNNRSRSNKDNHEVSLEKLPEYNYDDQYVKESSTIKVSENMENLLLQKQFEVKGSPRYDYYDNILFQRKFVASDLERIKRKPDPEVEVSKNKVKQAAYIKAKQEEDDKKYKDAMDEFKKLFENQKFDVEKVSDFELISDGRYDDSPILSFKIHTEFKNLISQAGPNYLVSIGTLIGSQLELKPDDMTRNFDIYQNYRRTFIDEISFEVPEGYMVADANGLNMNVDNESASFVSKAEITGNTLKIKTTKTYKQLYDPKTKWENYIKVLDAAYEFQQKKIILKKKA